MKKFLFKLIVRSAYKAGRTHARFERVFKKSRR